MYVIMNVYVRICARVQEYKSCIRVPECVRMCVRVHEYVSMCVRDHVCMCVYVHVFMNMYRMYVLMSVSMCTCTRIYIACTCS